MYEDIFYGIAKQKCSKDEAILKGYQRMHISDRAYPALIVS